MMRRLLFFASLAIFSLSLSHAEIPQSPRQDQAEPMFWLHTRGEMRAGLIYLQPPQGKVQHAVGAGGHIHLQTRSWHNLGVASTFYVVENIEPGGIEQERLNPDFFDPLGKGFLLAGEAYLMGKWDHSEIRLGRQALETPHIDGDDIRLLPNLYRAWTWRMASGERTEYSAGLVDRMAGWENGVDASRFVALSDVLGLSESTRGVFWMSATHNEDNWQTSLWAYRFDAVAQLSLLQMSFESAKEGLNDWAIALQLEHANAIGKRLLGEYNSKIIGLYLEYAGLYPGLELTLAYNAGYGAGGAFPSLGGGPYFTSLEDQTLDAIGTPGTAIMINLVRTWLLDHQRSLDLGVSGGQFRSARNGLYATDEIDLQMAFSWGKSLKLNTALALILTRLLNTEIAMQRKQSF
ncbi:MAG: hypothetical protein ACWA44_15625, partial [Thiotrichales bacterium]